MNTSTLTLKQLLPDSLDVDPDALGLRNDGIAAGAAGFVKDRVHEAIGEGLKVDVVGLVAGAWATTNEVREAARLSVAKGTPSHLYLAKHDVVCENKLGVVLEFAGVPAVTSHLALTLKAKFEGVGLTIDDGCIVEMDMGRGAAQAELKYGDAKLVGRSTDWVAIPVRKTFERPIRVPGVEAAASDALPAGVIRLPDAEARGRMAI